MTVREKRPVVCYKCGTVLDKVEAEWTQTGMARFREKAATLRRVHECRNQDTRKLALSDGSR